MALWKPLIQRGRVKMASRDMALRDAFHYQLAEYIQPLDKDDYHLLRYYNMMVVNRPAALSLQ